MHLGGRAFFIGPNASGKSNILDALRFLRDVAVEGLQGAVAVRGGMSEIRSLHTRRFPGVRIAVDVGSREQPARWSYQLHFRNHPLVKDYKLVGTEQSGPVEDCRLALRLAGSHPSPRRAPVETDGHRWGFRFFHGTLEDIDRERREIAIAPMHDDDWPDSCTCRSIGCT